RTKNDVFADEDCRLVVFVLILTLGVCKRIPADRGEAAGGMSIDFAVLMGKVHVGRIVVGLVNRQSARIRMMSVEDAAGSGKKSLRKMRAGASLAQHRRKNAGFQSAGKGGAIVHVDQARGDEILQNLVLVAISESCPVLNAGVRVADCVKRLLAKLGIANFFSL